MTRSLASLAFVCLSAICLHETPALARPLQQPAERTIVETTTKTKTTKTKTVTRPASTKAATPPKSASTASTKTTEKSGKRFWARIMGAFRDVHSAEKQPAE